MAMTGGKKAAIDTGSMGLNTKRQKHMDMGRNKVKEEKRRAWEQKMRRAEINQILVTGRSFIEQYSRPPLSRKRSTKRLIIDSGSDTD